MSDKGPNVIHKTLIIRFSSVGDVLLSSLLTRALRTRFPESTIDFLVKSEYADLVRHNPHINTVIEFPSHSGLIELFSLRASIKSTRYDLVIDIHDSLRSRLLSAGFRNVVRVNKRKLARFLLVKTKKDIYHNYGGAPSVALRYLETVSDYGVQNDGKGLEIHVPTEVSRKIQDLVSGWGQGSFIAISPSARHGTKMWLQERFAETAVALADHRGGIVLMGSRDERARCSDIEMLLRATSETLSVFNMAGELSLLETAALMDHCSVVIANDSGLMHLAAARKRPVVAVFGSTVEKLGFFPFGTQSIVVEDNMVDCRPCSHIGLPECPKGHFRCMKNIQSAQVINAAKKLMYVEQPSVDQ